MKIALAALLTALVIGLVLGPVLVPALKWLKFGQTIRTDGPSRHLQKAGTPTMGGIIFIIAFVVSCLIWGFYSKELFIVMGAVLAFGLVGFLDDFIKVALKRSLGLKAREKLVGQFFFAFLFVYLVCQVLGRGTDIIIPGLDYRLELGWFYYALISVCVVFLVNAVNLTDGLDGLCSGISFLVFLGYMIICLLAIQNPPVADMHYLDMAIAAGALAGGCLSFLAVNHYPAKVFMGDVGSLALGGGAAIFMIMTKTEVISVFINLIFIVEALSVTLQVISFRLFGKRIFLMSPLHHHYEMKGWSETRIVYTFYLVAGLGILCGLLFTLL